MKFTEENTLTLYHYFKELSDELRPVMNLKQYDKIDEQYWESKLFQLEKLIQNILDRKNLKEVE